MRKPGILCIGKKVLTSLDKAVFKGNDHSRIEARHLLRALLRQCTYLPDDAARHYAHSFIIERFRRYYPRPPESVSFTIKRRSTIIKQAYKALTLLERANNGHYSHLLKVLSMTYGRIGKRRHEMLQEVILLRPANGDIVAAQNVPKDEKALKSPCPSINFPALDSIRALQLVEPGGVQAPDRPSTITKPHDVTELVLGERLEALAKSQRLQNKLFFVKRQIKSLKSDIPLQNRWGRPMPHKRAKNLKKRWYADILDKTQPPLPEWEWNRLRDLIRGRIPWEGTVPRRARIASDGTPLHANSITATNKDITIISSSCFGESEAQVPEVAQYRLLQSNPHKITRRFMRGLWTRIFLQSPKMERDIARKKWIVTWGDSHQHKDIAFIDNTRIDSSMFDGVDEQGRIIRGQG